MITVTATEKDNNLYLVQTSEKVNGKRQLRDDVTMAEAARLHYFWTRVFIYERLHAFLKQRQKAYELLNITGMSRFTGNLLDRLEYRQYASLDILCVLVLLMENDIKLIAPGSQSRQYHYYGTTIKTILQYCRERKGLVQ